MSWSPPRSPLRARGRLLTNNLAAVLIVGFLGCSERETESPVLRVLAAASLTDAVTLLAQVYTKQTGAIVSTSFASSSSLARQIRDGAPADVFISASTEWVDELVAARATRGEPVVVAGGELVIVTAQNSTLEAAAPDVLTTLLEPGDTVAIADPGVPAGEYARSALDSLGLLDSYAPHLVGLGDVRAVLRAVELGEARAGFVYATDAIAAPVRILFAVDPTSHPPIRYQATIVAQSLDPAAAQRFVDFLETEDARAQLAALGFLLPPLSVAPRDDL